MSFDRLAFIDLETSGPSPARDRIVEIGIVAVDQGTVTEWSTLLDSHPHRAGRPWNRPKYAASPESRPPRFQDVADTLAAQLEGRLVIAHNARFDCNFLRAEFARARVEFQPRMLCSVALSRALYPQSVRHDLDSIVQRHGLTESLRHRALPDADLVRQFWEVVCREHPVSTLVATVDKLTAAPIYPPHLDSALLDRLPEMAGIYVLYDRTGDVLDAGAAYNLKRHVQDYFRVDNASTRALGISHRVADIRCKTTKGLIGAHLELAMHSEWRRRLGNADPHSWEMTAGPRPTIKIARLDRALLATGRAFGVFASARRAHNALRRLAAKHALCLHVLGLAETERAVCPRCTGEQIRPWCMSKTGRLRESVRALTALSPLHNPAWPFAGPVGLRERGAIHVLNEWRYLGSATNDTELRIVLNADTYAADVDVPMYRLIRRLLDRHARKLIPLARSPESTNE